MQQTKEAYRKQVEHFEDTIQQLETMTALQKAFEEHMKQFPPTTELHDLYGLFSMSIRIFFNRVLKVSTYEVMVLSDGSWIHKGGTIHSPTEDPAKYVFSQKENIYKGPAQKEER